MLDLISVVVHLLSHSVMVAATSLLTGQINVTLPAQDFYRSRTFISALWISKFCCVSSLITEGLAS